MKRWKRIMPLCMAAAVAAVTPMQSFAGSPEFARTAEEWARLRDDTLEYGEIGDLIHEYNAAVQNNQLDINKKRNEGNITSDEIAQSYRDAAADLRSSMSGESEGSDTALEAQARMMEMNADQNVEDLEVYKMTYAQTEATLVQAAQNNLISYHEKLIQLPALEKNKEALEAVYNATVAKKNLGMATQMDVLNAQKSIQDADASVSQMKADIQNLKQTLCVMMGWNYNASPEITNVPATDFSRVDQMNPQNDAAKAKENNYTLLINKRKLANATSDTTKQTLNATIRDNEQKIASDLTSKYQTIQQSKIAYDQAVSDYNLESQKMRTAEANLSLGTISRLEYVQQQSAVASKEAAMKAADLTLFQTMEAYDWAIKGLASTN